MRRYAGRRNGAAVNTLATQIESLQIGVDGSAFFQLYRDYIVELNQYSRHYGNPFVEPTPWWVDDADAQVHVAKIEGQLAGFVINGWRSRVDPDTESEILECYVAPAARRCGVGRQLAGQGFSLLSGSAGFQVYLDNVPAQKFWTAVLADEAVDYRTFGAVDRNTPVIKYRFAA